MAVPQRALALLGACAAAGAGRVTISNTEPRRDAGGRLMDVHDGNIEQWEPGGLYYWYGMGYGGCVERRGLIPPEDCPGMYQPFGGCGFQKNHTVSVYSSPDLVNWTFAGDALPLAARPEGIYFRPKVVRHQQRGEWVLWVNYLAEGHPGEWPLRAYPNATYVVAVSSSPVGPFKVVGTAEGLRHSGGGDFSLFVDENATAYIAYDAWSNSHTVTVERLTPDYRASTGVTSGAVSPSGNEAPALFERAGWYYLTFGKLCCFCHQGSGVRVFAARSPLGPYSDMGINIGRAPGGASVTGAQQNYVARLRAASGGYVYLWTGDRWASAPDHLKGHDLQFWQPLTFNDSVTPPAIAPLHWADSVSVDLP
eukprot:TRINITY_DN22323_c0_g1_i1.p1 TRINITY_DN22323_c0_g1~~TRINITY_DN22323_c0_g1_i1.p1  ORF type:complete len:366 (+),score=96.21 TRINITY_DN22323_c0_g1_i1:85-1182(+)